MAGPQCRVQSPLVALFGGVLLLSRSWRSPSRTQLLRAFRPPSDRGRSPASSLPGRPDRSESILSTSPGTAAWRCPRDICLATLSLAACAPAASRWTTRPSSRYSARVSGWKARSGFATTSWNCATSIRRIGDRRPAFARSSTARRFPAWPCRSNRDNRRNWRFGDRPVPRIRLPSPITTPTRGGILGPWTGGRFA